MAEPLITDSLSSWGENPLIHMSRLCLAFLQGLFEQAPRGQNMFHYDEDPQTTEVVITDNPPINSETVGSRPYIILVRAPVGFAGVAMDQLQSADLKTGTRVHTDLLPGNFTFNCVARHKNVAETLAWVVARHSWILRRILLTQGFHDFGQRIQILSPTPPGALIDGSGDVEAVNVAVVVPFYFQWQDTISPQEQRLAEAVEVRLTTLVPPVRKPTAVALDGSPGPGLRGTAMGAVVTARINSRRLENTRQTVPTLSTDTEAVSRPLEIRIKS